MTNAVAEMGVEACTEQQDALETLFRKGLNIVDVAKLAVATANSVSAWRDGKKLAASRMRRRLAELCAMPEEELKAALEGTSGYTRGRLTASEGETRVAAMRAAGLWPMDVCACRIVELSEGARAKGVPSTDLIEFLGVARRTFYQYRSVLNTRPLPVEVVRRLQLLEQHLAVDEHGAPAALRLLTLEGRFERASIILFGRLHYVGFAPGDPVKEHVLRVLAEDTYFDERTIRRYLPVRDKSRRVNRPVVLALEDVARRVGALV